MGMSKAFQSVMAEGPLAFHNKQMGVVTGFVSFLPMAVVHHTPS